MKYLLKSLLAAALAAGSVASQAAIVPVDGSNFVASQGQITFSEYSIGTLNPVYAASQYGAAAGAPTVSFGSFFVGQSTGTAATCPTGVALGGCIVGAPSGGSLLLDLDNGLGAITAQDTNHTQSPVLSGSPFLNGSIAMLFSTDQTAVSFDGGFFNAIGTTRVSAYDREGTLLGSILNTATGIQTLYIGDNAGKIAGLLVSLVAPEVAGFTIDGMRFGTIAPPETSSSTTSSSTTSSTSSSTSSSSGSGATNPPNETPEPTSLALVGLALLGLGAARRRRRA